MYTALTVDERNEMFRDSSIVTTFIKWKECKADTGIFNIYLRRAETGEKEPVFSFARALTEESSVITEITPLKGDFLSLPEIYPAVYDKVIMQLKSHVKQFKKKRLIIFTEEPAFIEAMLDHKISLSGLDTGVMGVYTL